MIKEMKELIIALFALIAVSTVGILVEYNKLHERVITCEQQMESVDD